MKNNRFKLILPALVLFVLLASLAACGDKGMGEPGITETTGAEPVTETAANTEPVTTEIVPETPDKKFGGKTFDIISKVGNAGKPSHTNFELYSEGYNGELINDAVYKRNLLIKEKFDVKITEQQYEYPTYELEKLINAGDDHYDAVVSYGSNLCYGATNGLLLSLYEVPHIDLSKPWWNKKSVDSLSINNNLYFASSDWTILDKSRAWVIFFNKSLAEEFHVDNLYQTVLDGKWTLDKMNEYMTAVAYDLNGNSQIDGDDRFGVSNYNSYSFISLFFGCGNKVSAKDENDMPYIDLYNERSATTVAKLLELFRNNTRVSLFPEDYDTSNQVDKYSRGVFSGGRALFFTGNCYDARDISQNAEFKFGIIPFPKFDEAQENYCTLIGSPGSLIGVPSNNVESLEMTGILLENLAYETKKSVLPVYYEDYLKVRYTSDDGSVEMLDMIFNNISYDICMIYNWGRIWEFLANKVGVSHTDIFASACASQEGVILSAMNNTLKAFE